MAKVIENKKGFKVIELSLSEVNKAFGGLGICDDCNKASFTHNYIAVLKQCYCPECYTNFNERATYYPEDCNLENRNFENASKKIGL
jgi:hypothetical protein